MIKAQFFMKSGRNLATEWESYEVFMQDFNSNEDDCFLQISAGKNGIHLIDPDEVESILVTEVSE